MLRANWGAQPALAALPLPQVECVHGQSSCCCCQHGKDPKLVHCCRPYHPILLLLLLLLPCRCLPLPAHAAHCYQFLLLLPLLLLGDLAGWHPPLPLHHLVLPGVLLVLE